MTFCSTALGGAACEMKGSNIAATRTSRFMPAILPAALTLGHHDFFGRVHEITLDELHAELPQHRHGVGVLDALGDRFDLELDRLFDQDRKSTRLNSSHSQISYAVFCLKKKKIRITRLLGQ